MTLAPPPIDQIDRPSTDFEDETSEAQSRRARVSSTKSRVAETFAYIRRHLAVSRALVIGAALVGTATAILLPSTYTARASFFPDSRSSPDLSSALGGGLSSIIGVLGISALGGGSQSPGLFVDLFKSQSFLDSLASSRIEIDSIGTMRTVAEYLVPTARNEKDRRWKARKSVTRHLSVQTQISNVVLVSVYARSPYAAASMANRAVDIIDQLNIEFRHRQAAARRLFTEQFLTDVQRRSDEAERRLEEFMLANRTFESSPVLRNRYTRLTAEVERLRTLMQQLESNVENSRLTEYNNAPVVARVDHAIPPERPSGPLRILIGVGSVVLTLLLIFWVAYLKSGYDRD